MVLPSRVAKHFNGIDSVRSLTPRQGNDPDAILSRVEASIKADNFNDALSSLSTIPESGMIIMAEWIKNLEEWVLVNIKLVDFFSKMLS